MYEIQVDGMTCGGCAASVKRAVLGVDSDARVDVDLKSKTIHVDSQLEVDAIKSAVVQAGYPVTSITKT